MTLVVALAEWACDTVEGALPDLLAQLPGGAVVRTHVYPKALAGVVGEAVEAGGFTLAPVGFTHLVVVYQGQASQPVRYAVHPATVWAGLQCGQSEAERGADAMCLPPHQSHHLG